MNEAKKFDRDKTPLELLPSDALVEVAKVLGFGRSKYAAWNWAKGLEHSRLYGAALRHLLASKDGEDLDPESQLDHVAHAACCVLFLLQHRIHKLGKDDRFVFKKAGN